MRKVAIGLMMMGLTACGGSGNGGGSGSGGSNDPGGSATIDNLSMGNSSTQCVKNNKPYTDFAVPTNSVTCSNAGGSWNATNMVNTADICRLSGTDFFVNGGGNASGSHQTACANVGGIFIASSTENKPYCSGYTPLTCSGNGGSLIVLDETLGDIHQPSVNLVSGNNTITLAGISASNISGVNSRPVYLMIHSKITYLGGDFWEAEIGAAPSSSFAGLYGYPADTPSFTVSLPIGTSANVVLGTASLYTDR